MFPEELVHCDADMLPDQAGVIAALCPKGEAYSIVEVLESPDIQRTVEEKATGWASHCGSGFLMYRIFVSDNAAERQRVLKKVRSWQRG